MSAPLVGTYDVIVVGSGPGGVNAAAPLVEAGRNVVLIDFGNQCAGMCLVMPHRFYR